MAVPEQVRLETFGVNGYLLDFSFSLPFGGCKQRGIGQELGLEGLAGHIEMKAIALPVDAAIRD